MTLKRRLMALEGVSGGPSRVIVIDGPKGIDSHAVLTARGIFAADRDLVVIIADPIGTEDTVSVTVDGQAR